MTKQLVTLDDLLVLKEALWPQYTFYDKQVAVLESALRDDETYVPSANKAGKDFILGFLAAACWTVCAFRGVQCRVVTTSSADRQLVVLWAEIGKFLTTAKVPLLQGRANPDAPFWLNFQELRLAKEQEAKVPQSYIIGQVSAKGETMQGHHADWNMLLGDESSAIDDETYRASLGWAQRKTFISNTPPCSNFFFRNVNAGDLPRDSGGGFHRKVIRIRADDIPNVIKAKRQQEAGLTPTDEVVVPGLLTWSDYVLRRKTWSKQDQQKGLDAVFPSDDTVLLFPPDWLEHSKRRAAELSQGKAKRIARAMGVDPAEGGDSTVWCIIDEWGVLHLVSKKTPDTTVIVRDTLDLMTRWGVPAEKIVFDRACGKAHADTLRMKGYRVQTVHFGESVMLDLKRGITRIEDRREVREEKSVYKNRRVEMYHELSHLMNPASARNGFGIPEEMAKLFFQLGPVPHKYDKESGDGKLILPDKAEMIQTLYNGEGSPDEADALVLAVYGLTHKSLRATAGAA